MGDGPGLYLTGATNPFAILYFFFIKVVVFSEMNGASAIPLVG
jgi:hypothetical protein